MNKQIRTIIAIAGLNLPLALHALTPDELIQNGRTALAAHSLPTAVSNFEAAVAAAPEDQTANALFGISRILKLAGSPQGKKLLDQMGVAPVGRDIYSWQADRPRTWPSSLNTDHFKLAANAALPELLAAESNLAKVTSSNFQLALSAEETSLQEVTLDYGDILMLRAMLKGAAFTVTAANCINTGVKPADVEAWLKSNALTMQHLLEAYPNLLSSGSGSLIAAGSQFSAFVDSYVAASDVIRARVSGTDANGVPFLFAITHSDSTDEVNADRTGEEARFRNNLVQTRQALLGPLAFDGMTQINIGSFANAAPAPAIRSLLPAFTYNHPAVSGTFPDPTFAGVVPDWTQADAQAAFARLGHSLDRHFKHKDDIGRPSLKITSPKSNARISATLGDLVTAAGTATDNIGVTRVEVRLSNDNGVKDYVALTGSNRAWSVGLNVAPGVNTITATAYDAWENASKSQSLSFTYVVTGSCSITSGSGGKIAPIIAGAAELAKTYSVTAIPNPGYIFQGWYSDPSQGFWPDGFGFPMSTNPKLTFKMRDGYTAYANFIPNPYSGRTGNYNALICQDVYDEFGGYVGRQDMGFVTLSVSKNGIFSGKLTYAGKSYPLRGMLDSLGGASFNISRGANLSSLWVSIDAGLWDTSGSTAFLSVNVSSDGNYSYGFPTQSSGALGVPVCNKFTFLLANPSFDDFIAHPHGSGYGTGAIDSKTRLARVVGTLPDGTHFTCSSFVDNNGALPIYSVLYSGSGQFSGAASFDSSSSIPLQSLTGTGLIWTRPGIATSLFPDPWQVSVEFSGAEWTAPSASDNWLPTAWLVSSDLSATQTAVDIGAKNKLLITPDSNQLKLSINFSTGAFQGSLLDPATSARIPFGGVLNKTSPSGEGFYLGNSIEGSVLLQTRP